MVANTKIEWAHHTFNPWEGCQKVGPGCELCYAETRNARFGGGVAPNWGPRAPRRRTSAGNWQQPLRWNAEAKRLGIRYRVFCASLADVFDNAVDPSWRTDLAELIEATPHLDWLLLTKRIGNAAHMMRAHMGWSVPPANVWLGATIVNQDEADRDIPKLLTTPAAKRFLSMEPLLGPVDLRKVSWGDHPVYRGTSSALASLAAVRLDWIIVGGESGHGARPMHPDWARSLCDQCAGAAVPFLFKQWGEWAHADQIGSDHPALMRVQQRIIFDGRVELSANFGDISMGRVGKKAAGRLLDGIQHDGVPA